MISWNDLENDFRGEFSLFYYVVLVSWTVAIFSLKTFFYVFFLKKERRRWRDKWNVLHIHLISESAEGTYNNCRKKKKPIYSYTMIVELLRFFYWAGSFIIVSSLSDSVL